MEAKAQSVAEYIGRFPQNVQQVLEEVRTTVQKAAPEAKETISYAMPAYTVEGKPLVYFAGYKNHIGFYATPTGHAAFKKQLLKYKQGKGSVQFPLDKDMPLTLITKMVKFRLKEVKEKLKAIQKFTLIFFFTNYGNLL